MSVSACTTQLRMKEPCMYTETPCISTAQTHAENQSPMDSFESWVTPETRGQSEEGGRVGGLVVAGFFGVFVVPLWPQRFEIMKMVIKRSFLALAVCF